MNKWQRDVLKTIEHTGASIDFINTSAKAHRLFGLQLNGRKFTLTVSNSPRCAETTLLAIRRTIRREANNPS